MGRILTREAEGIPVQALRTRYHEYEQLRKAKSNGESTARKGRVRWG